MREGVAIVLAAVDHVATQGGGAVAGAAIAGAMAQVTHFGSFGVGQDATRLERRGRSGLAGADCAEDAKLRAAFGYAVASAFGHVAARSLHLEVAATLATGAQRCASIAHAAQALAVVTANRQADVVASDGGAGQIATAAAFFDLAITVVAAQQTARHDSCEGVTEAVIRAASVVAAVRAAQAR